MSTLTTRQRQIRKEVEAEIVRVMANARSRGESEIKAARLAFPGTPDIVLYEAECALDYAEVEAWWDTIERTIDGEVIRNAVAAADKSGSPE